MTKSSRKLMAIDPETDTIFYTQRVPPSPHWRPDHRPAEGYTHERGFLDSFSDEDRETIQEYLEEQEEEKGKVPFEDIPVGSFYLDGAGVVNVKVVAGPFGENCLHWEERYPGYLVELADELVTPLEPAEALPKLAELFG